MIAPDCHLLYVLSGYGIFENNGQTFPLCPNTLIYYPSGFFYKISQNSEIPLMFYTINFDFSYEFSHIPTLIPYLTQQVNKKLLKTQRDDECFNDILYFQAAEWALIDINPIYEEALLRLHGFTESQSSHMRLLLINLFRHIKLDNEFPLVSAVKELVNLNPKLNNNDIADKLNNHAFYLGKIFKKNEGITLHQYIIKQRFSKAYELITTTKKLFYDISEECGFCSQSHFSRTFKKFYNTSPANFRK